jgi:hypothetical protein
MADNDNKHRISSIDGKRFKVADKDSWLRSKKKSYVRKIARQRLPRETDSIRRRVLLDLL